MIISGINKGGNLGDDITYSGTVSAAIEGCLLDIPSFAISLALNRAHHYETAGEIARILVGKIRKHGLPRDTFLNVNVPDVSVKDLKGIRITRQGRRRYSDTIVQEKDPRNRSYYWIGTGEVHYEPVEGSDIEAIRQNYVSITPLHLDMTDSGAPLVTRVRSPSFQTLNFLWRRLPGIWQVSYGTSPQR
jgi:5'-nucleotidase